jgi:hypothetical protein
MAAVAFSRISMSRSEIDSPAAIGDVADRDRAIQRGLHRSQRADVRAHPLGDREDGGVVLRARDLQAGIDPVLNLDHVGIGLVEVLQGDHRRRIGVDAHRHGRAPLILWWAKPHSAAVHSVNEQWRAKWPKSQYSFYSVT